MGPRGVEKVPKLCTVHLIAREIKPRRLRWANHGRRAFKILTGKPTGKRTLGMPIP